MTILAAVDNSEISERVVEFAIEEARLREEKLIFVHCVGPIPKGVRMAGEELKEHSIRVGNELLSNFTSKAKEDGVECESILVKEIKDPGKSIVELASKIKPSMVVVGVKKRSPAGKLLFGSTAQHVILNAEQPVVCVK